MSKYLASLQSIHDRQGLRVLLVVIVLLIPLGTTTFFTERYLNTSLTAFSPFINDEVINWHMVETFQQTGFAGGYYTKYEVPAPAEFTHFYTWGPVHPMIYGGLATLTGWESYTPVLINITLLTLALGLFMMVIRPKTGQIILIGLAMLTFWPVWLYTTSGFQESFQQAIGIGLAIIFILALNKRQHLTNRAVLAGSGFILFATMARLTWGIAIPLLFWLIAPGIQRFRQHRRRYWVAMGIVVLVGMVLVALVFTSMSAPYEGSRLYQIFYNRSFSALADNINLNLSRLFDGPALMVALRIQMIVLAVAVLLAYPIGRWWQRRYKDYAPVEMADVIFSVVMLASVFVFAFLFYIFEGWRDYRVIAPHLLVVLLVLIGRKRYALAGLVILSNILLFGTFRETLKDERINNFTTDQTITAEFEEQIAGVLVYDSGAESAWCNTVLTGIVVYPLMGVPPGIGISFHNGEIDNLTYPLKSRYILADKQIDSILDTLNVTFLTSTNRGDLYLNLNSSCDD